MTTPTSACDATTEGALRYIDASNLIELCDDSTWTAVGSGVSGATTQVIFNDGGSAYGGDAGMTYDKINDALTVNGSVKLGLTAGLPAPVNSFVAGSSGWVQFNDSGAFGASANLFWDNTNSRLGIGTAAPATKLMVGDGATAAGVIAILEDSDTGTNYASFTVPTLAANTVYTLPPDDGDAGEQLQTNGSGVLTWEAAGGAGIGVRIYNSANQSVATNTPTALTFDSETLDTDSMHSTSSNTGRITINTAGLYLVTGRYKIDANATGTRVLQFRLNGTTAIAMEENAANSANVYFASLTTLYNFAASDYIELVVNQFSGVSLNVRAAGTDGSLEFSAVRLAP